MVSDDEVDQAAAETAETYNLEYGEARDLVDTVVDAIEDGRPDDAAWDVQEQMSGMDAEMFAHDVADHLGYNPDDQDEAP